VAAKRVEVGDYVTPGQSMIELVDASRLEVRAPVPASDVPYVAEGTPVVIRVSSLPGESFAGRVVRLDAELDPAARTLGLVAELDNKDGRLRPGMLARVEIPRRELPEALLVPLDAVVDMEDARVVYVALPASGSSAEIERREVTLGPILGDRVVVERGLEPGDRVVVEGQGRVAPGQTVEVADQ
jgi:RND family efflux transporter MFP subunit